jgi:transcriptional regulator of arginine metabolism
MSAKLKRQNLIKEILNTRIISNHEVILKLLHAEGIKTTQATLSRDFAELGVIRVITDLGPRYILDANEAGKKIAELVGFEILNVQNNESLIVIRTLAGRAQGVAHYIDRLNKVEILGTVGGDDTVLVIPNKTDNIPVIVNWIKDLMNKHKFKGE